MKIRIRLEWLCVLAVASVLGESGCSKTENKTVDEANEKKPASKVHAAMIGHWKSKKGSFELYIDYETAIRVDSKGKRATVKYRLKDVDDDKFECRQVVVSGGKRFDSFVAFNEDRTIMFNSRTQRISTGLVKGTATAKLELIRVDDKTKP